MKSPIVKCIGNVSTVGSIIIMFPRRFKNTSMIGCIA